MCKRKIKLLTVTTDEEFQIDGANIFEGVDTEETCIVRDPVYKKRFEANIYEVQGKTCTFKVAIVEFSMCVYGIYLVKDRAGAKKKKDKRYQIQYAAPIMGYLAVIGAVLAAVTMAVGLELENDLLFYLLPAPFILLFLVSTILYLLGNRSQKKKREDERIAAAIYMDSLKREQDWKEKASQNDLALLDQIVTKFHGIGVTSVNTFTDILFRTIESKEELDILTETISLWDDLGREEELVYIVGRRGNKNATEKIICSYERMPEDAKTHYEFYDGALTRIADKRYKDVYLKWAKSWKDLAHLGVLMDHLAAWGIEEGKDIFLEQVFSKEDIDQYNPHNYANPRTQAYLNALSALSKYVDTDGKIETALQKLVEETDSKYIQEFAVKALIELKRDYDETQYLFPDIMG